MGFAFIWVGQGRNREESSESLEGPAKEEEV
jgi:hypothetical protein